MPRRLSRVAEAASSRQLNYIHRLWSNADDLSPLDITQQEIGQRLWGPVDERGPVSKDEGSYLISGLLRCPVKKPEVAVPVGYYWHPEGAAFQVVENGTQTGTYAKVLVRLGKDRKSDFWAYRRGAVYTLDPSMKVTLATCVRRFRNISAQ